MYGSRLTEEFIPVLKIVSEHLKGKSFEACCNRVSLNTVCCEFTETRHDDSLHTATPSHAGFVCLYNFEITVTSGSCCILRPCSFTVTSDVVCTWFAYSPHCFWGFLSIVLKIIDMFADRFRRSCQFLLLWNVFMQCDWTASTRKEVLNQISIYFYYFSQNLVHQLKGKEIRVLPTSAGGQSW